MPFHYPLYKHHHACTFHGILFSYDDGPSMEKDFLYDVARMNSMDLGYTFWQERECLGEKKST